MPRYHNINGEMVQFTADEETARDAEEKAWADAADTRAAVAVREERDALLAATDWMYQHRVASLIVLRGLPSLAKG